MAHSLPKSVEICSRLGPVKIKLRDRPNNTVQVGSDEHSSANVRRSALGLDTNEGDGRMQRRCRQPISDGDQHHKDIPKFCEASRL